MEGARNHSRATFVILPNRSGTPVKNVFAYWSNFENFPGFMQNIEEVRMTGEDTSHWRVKGPLGKSVEFDARTTVDGLEPRDRLAHCRRLGDDLWEVRFEEIPPDRTRVEVTMNYADPPGGKAGEIVAEAISNPEIIVKEDLQNFAGLVERGELGGARY